MSNQIPYYRQLINDIRDVHPSSSLDKSDRDTISQAISNYEPAILARISDFDSDSIQLGIVIGLAEAIRKERP